eukprot:TRINITY_DN6893_c0_g1_i1.p1 TRINITY_DN6893_c0_g1~~TRINITY_DN6893_c0_g1_i1.p1  ORF type:complete len:107 (+),score=18.97 TRINITY_DN6893_c0_g1_i1:322-642(+)
MILNNLHKNDDTIKEEIEEKHEEIRKLGKIIQGMCIKACSKKVESQKAFESFTTKDRAEDERRELELSETNRLLKDKLVKVEHDYEKEVGTWKLKVKESSGDKCSY